MELLEKYFTRKQNVRSTHLIVCEVWHTFESIKYVILVILLQLFNLQGVRAKSTHLSTIATYIVEARTFCSYTL